MLNDEVGLDDFFLWCERACESPYAAKECAVGSLGVFAFGF